MLNLLRNLLSGLLSFLLVPLLLSLVILLATSSVFLNKETFISTLKTNNTFAKVSNDIIPSLLVNLSHRENTQISIPSEVTLKLFQNIDKSQLSKDLESLISDTHDYVTGKNETFSSRISVEPFAKSISANLKPEVTSYINGLTACTEVEEQKLSSEEVKTLTCKPKSMTTEQLIEEIGINEITEELEKNSPKALVVTENDIKTDPEIIKLNDFNKPNTDKKSVLEDLRTVATNLNSTIAVLFTLVIVLAILLFASRLPKIDSGCKWISSALFSSSIFPFAFGLLMLTFAKPEMFRDMLKSLPGTEQDPQLASAASSLAGDNLALFMKQISQNFVFYSIGLISLSIVLFIAHILLSQKAKKSLNLSLDSKKP
jgi:hypothetical protein